MVAVNTESAIRKVLQDEGGSKVTNDPTDPGGITKYGVTIPALSEYLGRKATPDEIRELTEDVAVKVYKKRFWDVVGGNVLPSGLDYAVFDAAVNCGPGRAQRWLKAAQARFSDTRHIILSLNASREAHYRSLPTQQFTKYGKGWLNRLSRVEKAALEMAS